MSFIKDLNRTRALAGLQPLSEAQYLPSKVEGSLEELAKMLDGAEILDWNPPVLAIEGVHGGFFIRKYPTEFHVHTVVMTADGLHGRSFDHNFDTMDKVVEFVTKHTSKVK